MRVRYGQSRIMRLDASHRAKWVVLGATSARHMASHQRVKKRVIACQKACQRNAAHQLKRNVPSGIPNTGRVTQNVTLRTGRRRREEDGRSVEG